ncbi:MAG: DEAD/DEAH box helicase [Chitinophagales bacterium]
MEVVFAPENEELLRLMCEGSSGDRTALRFFAGDSQPGGAAALHLPERLPTLRLYPHQEAAVSRVLTELGGRAILADDVGLGKTIEAAALLSEYRWRGLIRRALILAPAALLKQWEGELFGRFGLTPVVARRPADWRQELVVGSLDLAKREDHRRWLLAEPWDLVVVDEAHRLKNLRTANWQLVHDLETTYLLLLTATPLQNDLRELYSLVTLVRPGLFSTLADFRQTFQADRLALRNADLLKERLSSVMLRSDRRKARVELPARRVKTLSVDLSPGEAELYAACLGLLDAARGTARTRQQILPLVVLLREATSSPEAARRTLLRMARTPGVNPATAARYREVAAAAKGAFCRKAAVLRDLAAARRDKLLVFTEFRGTQEVIAKELLGVGICTVKYHGGLTAEAQAKAVEAFAGEARVMVATEAGAEGHNLQFCNWLVNFDLPWNPMRLEQRIGRLHRLGQEKPVEVTNLVAAGTVEAYVLSVLGAKLELCETVLGELELVLEHGLERRIADVVLAGRTEGELELGFARLLREIIERRKSFAAAASRVDALLGLPGEGGPAGD